MTLYPIIAELESDMRMAEEFRGYWKARQRQHREVDHCSAMAERIALTSNNIPPEPKLCLLIHISSLISLPVSNPNARLDSAETQAFRSDSRPGRASKRRTNQ